MASHVEVRFIDESDFVINGKGFILKDDADNLDWEVHSTISLEWNDLLDEKADFEEELRSDEDSDPDRELSSSPSARYDHTDDSDFDAGPSAPNKGARKKPKTKSKQRAGIISRYTKNLKQPNVNHSTSEATSTRNSNTKGLQANRGEIQNKKGAKIQTKKELDEVMMKLEGKRPMCRNFVSEQLSKQPVMKHLENHRKLLEEILDV